MISCEYSKRRVRRRVHGVDINQLLLISHLNIINLLFVFSFTELTSETKTNPIEYQHDQQPTNSPHQHEESKSQQCQSVPPHQVQALYEQCELSVPQQLLDGSELVQHGTPPAALHALHVHFTPVWLLREATTEVDAACNQLLQPVQ